MGMNAAMEIGLALDGGRSGLVYGKSTGCEISKQMRFMANEHFGAPMNMPRFLITDFQLDARLESKNGADWGTKTPIVISLTQRKRKKRGGGGGGEGENIYKRGYISMDIARTCPNVPQGDEKSRYHCCPTGYLGAHAKNPCAPKHKKALHVPHGTDCPPYRRTA